VEVDAALDAGYPERRASRVEIEMDGGQVFREAVENARGEPEWPLTPREIEEKFLALAAPGLGAGAARRIPEAITRLESLQDVSQLTRLLVPGSAP
jgi:2-methylcitrate dehydratase PrpD